MDTMGSPNAPAAEEASARKMHELFMQVLKNRDLSRAGDLFAIPDSVIVNNITNVLNEITVITSLPEFIHNTNDQSVVEICVTRVTSCIRETGTVEQHCDALVNLLESCLHHNLQLTARDEDPPHAKISSDIISCIFFNYNKKSVMQRALPVAVKFLHKGNKELSRNVASYLSLAVIKHASILTPHVQPIMDSIISGNYPLCRVLPNIYEVSPEPFQGHAMALVSLLPHCENQEKLALLNLFSLIAKDNPSLLEASVPQLCEYLSSSVTASSALQVFLHMAEKEPALLADHVNAMKQSAQRHPQTVSLAAQIIGAVGKLSQDRAQDALNFVLEYLPKADRGSQTALLREATLLCSSYPVLFTDKVLAGVRQRHHASTGTSQVTSGGVTIVKVGGNAPAQPSVYTRRAKLGDSRSTGRLHTPQATNTHRSMTKLNIPGGSIGGLHKSMTRLSSSQQINSINNNNAVPPPPSSVASTTSSPPPPPITTSHHQRQQPPAPQPPPFAPTTTPSTNINNISSNSNVIVTTGVNKYIINNNISSGGVTVTTVSPPRMQRPQSQGLMSTSTNNQIIINPLHHHHLPPPHLPPPPHPSHQHSYPHHHQQQQQQQLNSSNSVTVSSVYTGGPSSPATSPSSSALYGSHGGTGHVSVFTNHNNNNNQNYHHHHMTAATTQTIPIGGGGPGGHHHILPPNMGNNNTGGLSVVSEYHGMVLNTTNAAPPPPPPPIASPSLISGVTVVSRRANNTSVTLLNANNNQNNSVANQRISVFEPYPMRDTIQHFCEKHLDKIKAYMDKISIRVPTPVKCTIEEKRQKNVAKLHFVCQGEGEHCLYAKTWFTMRTRNPKIWIHLMFIALQAQNAHALSSRDPPVASLKHCWDILKCENKSFLTLVTSAFPCPKDQDVLISELRHAGYFDMFQICPQRPTLDNDGAAGEGANGVSSNGAELQQRQTEKRDGSVENNGGGGGGSNSGTSTTATGSFFKWGCFLCAHPERAVGFLRGDTQPVIEGQLKEKKGRWRLFRRWRTRYFTLSGAHLSCRGSSGGESIDVNQIRSVKVSRGARNIPKAFEIFTGNQTLILKPKDGKNAEEWVQCLSIVVAHSHAKELPGKSNSLPARGVSTSRTAI